jgi:hypothetical protein
MAARAQDSLTKLEAGRTRRLAAPCSLRPRLPRQDALKILPTALIGDLDFRSFYPEKVRRVNRINKTHNNTHEKGTQQ